MKIQELVIDINLQVDKELGKIVCVIFYNNKPLDNSFSFKSSIINIQIAVIEKMIKDAYEDVDYDDVEVDKLTVNDDRRIEIQKIFIK